MTRNRKMLDAELLKVMQIDPAIWPEQHLADEIAQLRARRYLLIEKELL